MRSCGWRYCDQRGVSNAKVCFEDDAAAQAANLANQQELVAPGRYALRLPFLFQHAQALMARSWVVPDQIGSSTVVQLALFHSARLVLRMLTQNLHMV